MLKVEIMTADEMRVLLLRLDFGHLGCSRDGHPYVVPMHYVYDGEELYFLTTEGTKTEFIAANDEVCFQVEEITDPSKWRSVMLVGSARRIRKPDDLERAMQLFTARNPTLTPALNRTDVGPWHRQNNLAIYRVKPTAIYGRRTGV
ncbi:MAG: uncharacterized protein QOJ64_857 [Acidobacteriota bacterium]|jgi:nitroimidazol reductase NimA-like FMN-containing flavoprotein (pyridoxamine 5'-phosphate oxidase superfamily)|nr:uncharacterized protein [Acidobacteriota bacterium]